MPRPKGSKNKLTLSVKEAIQRAFDDIGGARALAVWAKQDKNRTAFYTLYGRLIPHEVVGKDSGPVQVTVTHHFDK